MFTVESTSFWFFQPEVFYSFLFLTSRPDLSVMFLYNCTTSEGKYVQYYKSSLVAYKLLMLMYWAFHILPQIYTASA